MLPLSSRVIRRRVAGDVIAKASLNLKSSPKKNTSWLALAGVFLS
jgi:hypothetical protein